MMILIRDRPDLIHEELNFLMMKKKLTALDKANGSLSSIS